MDDDTGGCVGHLPMEVIAVGQLIDIGSESDALDDTVDTNLFCDLIVFFHI